MAKLRLRDLLLRYPRLDRLRIEVVSCFIKNVISFFDTSYRTISLIAPGARDYVKTLHSNTQQRIVNQKPCLFAFFHGQMFCLLSIEPRANMTALASNSRDGEIIARGGIGMGYNLVRGSRTHGGVKGALDVLEHTKRDHSILFNVDGPRGPRHVVKESIIRLAALSGLPIVPVVGEARSNKKWKSWDRYVTPYLNSEMVIIFGEPIFVPANATKDQRESLRSELQASMDELYQRCETFQVSFPD